MSTSQADIDRILSLINEHDIESLKSSDFDIFQYQGFDPYKMLQVLVELKNAKSISNETFQKDICQMVAIGLIKGNVNEHNITKMSDDGQVSVTALMVKYGIDMKKSKDKGPKIITFPRVMATFPDIAVRFTKVLGGKKFPGPFDSQFLPDCMQVSVFPAIIPNTLNAEMTSFLLVACLCYSVDQSIKISLIDKPDLKNLCAEQKKFINVGYGSPLPRQKVRIQTFNLMGLPGAYSAIAQVVNKYRTLVDDKQTIPSENDYKQALSIV